MIRTNVQGWAGIGGARKMYPSSQAAGIKGGYDTYTKLMLHCNGADGSTVLSDSSSINPKSMTVHDGAHLVTADKVFGTASLYVDGGGDYFSTPDSNDWDFAAGDFTVDLRAKGTGTATNVFIIGQRNSNWGIIWHRSGNIVSFILIDGGGSHIYDTTGLSVVNNTWYHIAVVRYGNSLKIYIDGTAYYTNSSYTETLANGTDELHIGSANSQYFNGWIDEVRVSKGIARWTGNFTPPTYEY